MPGVIANFRKALFLSALALCPADAVMAQSAFETVTTITPPPAAQPVPRRERGAPQPAPRTETRTQPPALRPTVATDPLDPYAPTAAGEQPGGPAAQDGASGQIRGPTQPVDGVFDLGEPEAPVDGANPSVRDYRSAEERERFQGPPVGFDPRLFQIELEPVLDRRPRQLFRFAPYQPTGIRAGSYIVLPEIEFGTNWRSNVFSEPNARSDVSFDVRPALRVVSNWRRHAVEFRARGTFSSFQRFDTENERLYTLEARSRLDITRRTNIGALISRDVTQESRSELSATANALERADVTTDRIAATLNHRFNRLRLQLRGAVSDTAYGEVPLEGGGTAVSDRDVRTTTAAVRASWEFKPTLFLFAEVGLDHRDFKTVALADGLSRDSDGERYRVGLSFGNTGEYLRGEISLGYGRQAPRDGRLEQISGILVDANLAWRPTRLTSLLFTGSTNFIDTDIAGSPGAISYRLGVELQHQLRRNLLLQTGLQHTIQSYEGIDLIERDWTATAGLEYSLNRTIALLGNYQYTHFRSDQPGRDYEASIFRLGMRLRR